MEFKSLVSIEVTKGERVYRFTLPTNSPIGEAYDACHIFLESVVKMAHDAVAKTAPKEIEEEPTVQIETPVQEIERVEPACSDGACSEPVQSTEGTCNPEPTTVEHPYAS